MTLLRIIEAIILTWPDWFLLVIGAFGIVLTCARGFSGKLPPRWWEEDEPV